MLVYCVLKKWRKSPTLNGWPLRCYMPTGELNLAAEVMRERHTPAISRSLLAFKLGKTFSILNSAKNEMCKYIYLKAVYHHAFHAKEIFKNFV